MAGIYLAIALLALLCLVGVLFSAYLAGQGSVNDKAPE